MCTPQKYCFKVIVKNICISSLVRLYSYLKAEKMFSINYFLYYTVYLSKS